MPIDNNNLLPPEEEAEDVIAPGEDVVELNATLTDEEAQSLAGQHLRFHVGHNLQFRRLDKYLCGRFSCFSRTRLQKLIREQGVNVNGRPAKPSYNLSANDEVDLILPPRELRELTPEDIPINVIYEDENILVLNKQAGLIVHPARGYKNGTLVNGLVYHFQKLSGCAEDFRPGIVHRLDRNTTGCLVVAKDDTSHWKLSRQFADRTTKKTYLAIVHGTPELDADRINQPLGVHPAIREKFAIRPDIGKEAVTFYHVLEKFVGYTVVQLDLKTGRTHQIRVHMSWIKHPIVADDMYGGKAVYRWQIENRDPAPEEPLLRRCALHAWKLELNHPVSGERMEFTAPMPDDMQQFVDELRKHRSQRRA